MNKPVENFDSPVITTYDRNSNDPEHKIRVIGSGSIGGKAQGLAILQELISSDEFGSQKTTVPICVPELVVIGTSVFDQFIEINHLRKYIMGDYTDDQIAHAFQHADLPFFILGDLQTLIAQIRTPIAIRSSSLLEDATYEPFAGIYTTKMIPNQQFDPDFRFRKLTEAIKFVYASTFFGSANSYRIATGHNHQEEKMAVIIQKIHGSRHHLRYYPDLSGVARSYNYYPMGKSNPEDGVVNLALGLGKTIVDGGITWSYSPSRPKIGPPFGSTADLLKHTQKRFWAVNMGAPLIYDPIRETEYLIQADLQTAERDGTLKEICSTYDPGSDRVQIGMGSPGPRVINFAPLLQLKKFGLNDLIQSLLNICQDKIGAPVEIEFAMTFSPPSLGLLQVRPMVVSSEEVDVTEKDLENPLALAVSENALGNGIIEDIRHIVYVSPDHFELEKTQQIAAELEELNKDLVENYIPYLLIVFGRLGSSDPWLGIPVNWGQISGARVIIETFQESFSVDLSQGSHFFHNMTSLGVSYLSVPRSGRSQVNWTWLLQQKLINQTAHMRHVQLKKPLTIKIDGKTGRAVVIRPKS